MFEVKITIAMPDLSAAIHQLAVAVNKENRPISVTAPFVLDGSAVGTATPQTPVSPVPVVPQKTEPGHTLEEVRAALAKLSQEKGKAVAKKLLANLDATKVTELNPEVYDAVMQNIREQLGEG